MAQGRSRTRCAVVAIIASLTVATAAAAVIGEDLERALARRGTHADTAVILRFSEPLALEPLAVASRSARDNRLLLALKARFALKRSQIQPLLERLQAQHIRDLWLVHGVAMTLPAVAVKQLAQASGVARIDLDSFVQGGRSQRTPPARAALAADAVMASASVALPVSASVAKPSWNVAAVHAPELWALGHTGKGVVVATMDTGADLAHPELRRKWRGGTHSWFDPHGEQALPYDALGHGTQTLGVIVGDSGLGLAPDATWISVRLYNNEGRASMSDIHLAFQWLMDPDGDASTLDAPDVVNASWSLAGRASGTCVMEFDQDIRVLRSAGVLVVFAAGNDGPAPGTSNSPGNNPGVLSVGAVDQARQVARQSSRGPSACDGGPFPSLVAPGVNVRTTDLSHGGQFSYTTASGSSLAAPHVSGVLALMAGAFPDASVAQLESALLHAAQPAPGHNAQVQVDALATFKALRQLREPVGPAAHASDPNSKVQ